MSPRPNASMPNPRRRRGVRTGSDEGSGGIAGTLAMPRGAVKRKAGMEGGSP
jgi:hypothetical protein